MGPIPVAALGSLGVVVTAILTFIAVKIKLSGRIDTTEANVLWTATESLRHDLAEQLKEREAIIIRQAARINSCDADLHDIRNQLITAKTEAAMYKRKHEQVERELQRLREEKGGDRG